MVDPLIEFRIDARSGVPPYLQIAQQVRQSVRLGLLREGDQLPTVKEVVAQVAINPNTVLKAYRELEHEGIAEGRPGIGTFVTRSFDGRPPGAHKRLQADLARWVARAQEAGLDDEDIAALFDAARRARAGEDVA
jgi:GntR family transcriptional regulator